MKKRVYCLWKIIWLQDIIISFLFCNVLLIIKIIMHIMFFLSFRVILPINFFLMHLIWHLLTVHVHKVHRYQDRYLIKCQMIYRISSFTMWYCNKLQDMHFYFIFRKLGALQIRRDKLKCNNHNTLFVFSVHNAKICFKSLFNIAKSLQNASALHKTKERRWLYYVNAVKKRFWFS